MPCPEWHGLWSWVTLCLVLSDTVSCPEWHYFLSCVTLHRPCWKCRSILLCDCTYHFTVWMSVLKYTHMIICRIFSFVSRFFQCIFWVHNSFYLPVQSRQRILAKETFIQLWREPTERAWSMQSSPLRGKITVTPFSPAVSGGQIKIIVTVTQDLYGTSYEQPRGTLFMLSSDGKGVCLMFEIKNYVTNFGVKIVPEDCPAERKTWRARRDQPNRRKQPSGWV